jgi:RimJ/RimL family protein N-acetyltransferase
MEKILNESQFDRHVSTAVVDDRGHGDWRMALPVLNGERVRLRELRRSDASSLLDMFSSEEVTRFVSAPPTTMEGFEAFVTCAESQRSLGAQACFAITLRACDTAIGIIQMRQLDPGFETGEWGFALRSAFWGTGVFQEAAELALEFAFSTIGVHRLEARAAVKNGRGNGALLKLGAVQEGLLRKSFVRSGQALDQILYSILDDDWLESRTTRHISQSIQVH